jgi:hypothetical protein
MRAAARGDLYLAGDRLNFGQRGAESGDESATKRERVKGQHEADLHTHNHAVPRRTHREDFLQIA